MMNLSNYGIVTGRLVKDPAVYTNADGSRKTKITIATQNNYRNSQTGEKEAQFLPLESFTPADRDREQKSIQSCITDRKYPIGRNKK